MTADLMQLRADQQREGMGGIHHCINGMGQTVSAEIFDRAKRTHMQSVEVCRSVRACGGFRDDADADIPACQRESRDQRRALTGACKHKNVDLAIRASVHQDGAHRIDRG